jgi:hypothetical protein
MPRVYRVASLIPVCVLLGVPGGSVGGPAPQFVYSDPCSMHRQGLTQSPHPIIVINGVSNRRQLARRRVGAALAAVGSRGAISSPGRASDGTS